MKLTIENCNHHHRPSSCMCGVHPQRLPSRAAQQALLAGSSSSSSHHNNNNNKDDDYISLIETESFGSVVDETENQCCVGRIADDDDDDENDIISKPVTMIGSHIESMHTEFVKSSSHPMNDDDDTQVISSSRRPPRRISSVAVSDDDDDEHDDERHRNKIISSSSSEVLPQQHQNKMKNPFESFLPRLPLPDDCFPKRDNKQQQLQQQQHNQYSSNRNQQHPRLYTMDEVQLHNHENSAWLLVGDDIYDATPFLHQHPGGIDCIMKRAGGIRDCTKDYFFHSKQGRLIFKKHYIGKLVIHEDHDQHHHQHSKESHANSCNSSSKNKEWWQLFWH